MRTLLLRALLALLAVMLVTGLVGFGYVSFAVRCPWPRTDGRGQVDGLQAAVTVIRGQWAIPHICASNPHDLPRLRSLHPHALLAPHRRPGTGTAG